MNEILICTHDPMLIKGLCNPLRDAGYQVTTVDHAAKAIQLMLEREPRVVIIDSQVVGLSVSEALPIIRHVAPRTRVIVIGETGAEYDVRSVSRLTCLEDVKCIASKERV